MNKQPITVSKKELLERPLETCSALAYKPDQGIYLENGLSFHVRLLN